MAKERRERRVYGFVEAATQPDGLNGYARMDMVLDAVDADAFDGRVAQNRAPESLSMIRIMTTPRRLLERFDLRAAPMEGNWFEVLLAPARGQPPAWILEAANDYGGAIFRTNVVRLDPLERPLRTSLDSPHTVLPGLRALCTVGGDLALSDRVSVPPLETSGPPHIRIIDVGHASCAAIHVARDPDSRIIGYYDVGAPVFFHQGTFPKAFLEGRRVPDQGFVVLSHWDFDHYALAVSRLQALQQLQWYTPKQDVGPNAARLQALLGNRLHFFSAQKVPILPNLNLWKGQGLAADRNNSGYVLRASHRQLSVLLTGDVGYAAIPAAAKRRLRALEITHHGGNGSANPPRPHGAGNAVVSYGSPNRYGHPSEPHLAAHVAAGWALRRTAGDAAHARGDIWLS